MNAHSRDFMDRVTEDDVLEAEQTLIASAMFLPESFDNCGLEANDLSIGLHQIIFKAASDLRAAHQHVNPVSLKPYVPKDVQGLNVSPAQYLTRLSTIGAPLRPVDVDQAAEIVKGSVIARRIAQEAQYMAAVASEGLGLLTIGDELEQLESRLKELRARFAETTAISSPGSSYLTAFQASARRDGVIGVPIALPEIAMVLSEPVFEAGNLYGLLSSSGEGKSSLTMQLIYHAVSEGHPVLFLSYDQSSAQCVRQMIAQVHGIDVRQQREPSRLMSQKEQDQCVSFATWIDRQPLQIIRCQREGVTQLVAYARRFIKQKANGKTPFVVIDHIGKVKPRDPKLSPDRISGEVTVELKALADETQSSILILNQRNSFGTRRDNPRPISADLYGGEGARADYDAVLTLYRPEKYKKEREKIASKPSDWTAINSVFGSDIEGIAELATIKVRFGDPSIVEKVKFEARFTRYVSMRPERERELPL
ncbi:DnaB-like helicase C-terminal domain-containing protein [Rhizobium sp. NLR22b]|uniref:DnaB-like helicase C-terminal domain-containing protein n=1 Tax=Rhizobium sp. NLR22b TaxID=2731115 RepID=UPI001C83D9E2|nr:DnaB-like helicase C-terminal domain-containing protein [Rhizobium sp. NLR22b]MBX5238654.1 helicase DnaB [Rhizobium sp. NLR22b]